MAEDGAASPLAAACAISAPVDLAACARAIDAQGGIGALYRLRFLRSLRKKAVAKGARLPRTRGIVEFDDLYTAPVHGFAGAAAYYADSSAGPRLGAIRRPTLMLWADDDPMVPKSTLPLEAAAANPWLSSVVTRGGGHVGFVTGSAWRPRFWAEDQALRFPGRAPRSLLTAARAVAATAAGAVAAAGAAARAVAVDIAVDFRGREKVTWSTSVVHSAPRSAA